MRSIGEASQTLNSTHAKRRAGDLIEQANSGEVTLRSEQVGSRKIDRTTLGGMITHWADRMLAQGSWTERHHAKTLERMEKHLSALWKQKAAELTRPQITRHLETIESVDTAGRMFSWVKESLEDACDRGELDFCVLGRKPKSLTVPKSRRNTRPSYGDDIGKLSALYSAIRLSDAARSVRLAGQLVLLTGLRMGEITHLRKEYYNPDTAELVIPREAMKETDHWRGDFIVPLSEQAKAVVVQGIETANGEGWLFPGPRTKKPVTHEGIEKLFQRLTNREHTPHGTRTSLKTWALHQGHPPIVCRSLIDHATSTGADEHYDRTSFVPQRREILEAWAGVIANG
jgi:integrase